MGLFDMLRRRCSALALLVAVPTGSASAAPLLSDRKDFFPIGVWQQPTYNFSKWKSRGINVLMEMPEGQDINAWSNAAVNGGYYMIRRPNNGVKPNDPAAVAAARKADLTKYRASLLAWTTPDEVDFNEMSANNLLVDYRAMKAVDSKNPPTVLMNFSGGTALGLGTRDGDSVPNSRYQAYTKATDWVSNDFYPVTGWGRSDWIDYSKEITDRRTPGKAVDKLRMLSGDKPQLAVIETSDQNLAWVPGDHGVNRAQFRGQLWHSIIHGAQGIIYFPFQFRERFTFDATPADVAEEMTIQHARVQRLASVINAKPNPKELSFVAGSKKSSRLLEVTWRRGRGADYFFVLNMSSMTVELPFDLIGVAGSGVIHGENRTLRPNSEGTYKDKFAPWEMHVYKFAQPLEGVASKRSRSIAAVPEPGMIGFAGVFAGLLLRRARF